MIDLFYTGGPLLMGILTIILISMAALAIYIFVRMGNDGQKQPPIIFVKEIGVFGLVLGIFGQFLGLYQAFLSLEQVGSVSPVVLISGLKVSSVTTIYGFLICILGWLLYFGLKAKLAQE